MAIHLESWTAGRQERGAGYSYFVPSELNDEWHWEDPRINALLERAAVRLGELNAFARLVPNIHLFIQLHVAKEAVVSSRIEGTQTHIDEALLSEEEVDPQRRSDWVEVNNYIHALHDAIASLESLPISSRLLRQTHARLLRGARGKEKLPGEFRRSQNWIGGHSLSDAVFIPPHHSYLAPLMGDLETFLHNDRIHVPALIRIGIAHYQFETIHPFLDGNGRIGRLLITLFLVEQRILDRPLLYISSFFEENRGLYYDNLMRVREKNDIGQWLRYFLNGVEKTADQSVKTLSAILRLKLEWERKIQASLGRRSTLGLQLLEGLFEHPVTSASRAMERLSVSKKTANELIRALEGMGALRETTGQARNRIFFFFPYLDLFE